MADPVEVADSFYDDSLEVVGTESPGAEPYKLRVKVALQTAIASHTSELADHESRIDALEGATPGDITAVTAGTGLTGGGTSGDVSLAVAYGTSSSTACVGNDSRLSPTLASLGLNEYWCVDANISYGSKTDEFTAGSLGGNWAVREWSTWSTPTNGGNVNSTTSPSASNYFMTPNARNSWLMLQPAPSGTGVDLALRQSFTYVGASGFQFRFRFTPAIIGDVSSGAATNNGLSRIYLCKDSSSNPDTANNVFFGYSNANPQTIICGNTTGGGGTTTATYTAERNNDYEFIFIGSGNVGTISIKMYLRGPTGTRLLDGAETLAVSNGGTIWIVWRMTSTNAAVNIYAMDYFREYPDLKITP